MALKFKHVKNLGKHPAIAKPRAAYARHHYSTPLFVLRETLSAFQLHNGFGLAASLSFYAMFALIPLILLMFFFLSHLVLTSDYAIVKLAILTSNLVPKFSNRIMIEVYNVSKHKAVWGAFGMLALFWIVTPLAGALRSSFYTIASKLEVPSFIKRKVKDVFAVLGILLMLFIFMLSGVMLEKILAFLNPSSAHIGIINTISTIIISTLLITFFYRAFFPVRISWQHILIGSVITALLWTAMRPAFGLFLTLNQSYGSMFGGMKNMFISIGWLYYTFAVFLLGTELISTLRKKDVLLLRALFSGMPQNKVLYLRELMSRFGKTYHQGDYIFRQGDEGHDLYYIVSGRVSLLHQSSVLRELSAGDYFGEMAMLAETARIADARVESEVAKIIIISAENVETLLMGEPRVAMNFLKQLATRLQNSHQAQS